MIDPAARIRRVILPEQPLDDPLLAIAHAPGEPAFYWRSDAARIEVAALGAVRVVEHEGRMRFSRADADLRRLAREVGEEGSRWPLLVGGFAFADHAGEHPWDGFPALRFFVPRALWVRRGSARTLVVTYAAGREQTPLSLLAGARLAQTATAGDDAEEMGSWMGRVTRVQAGIRRGELSKAVLARRRSVRIPASLRVEELVSSLAHARPGCATFWLRWSGRHFVGSSPERLACVRDGQVRADALAGSAGRGRSPSHDDSLRRELMASPKEQREHRIVVDAITSALAPVAASVEAAQVPGVMTLPEAWHLHTPVHATLRRRTSLLEVARRLHPTPAVCGWPAAPARRLLGREESGRGWYSGAVGWIDGHGDGELAVALRAALLDGATAHVWAGAGIVEGSDPAREYEETERKMSALLPYFEGLADDCAA